MGADNAMTRPAEIEVAARVVQWLQDHDWEVYQEVQINSYGAVADIVATFNNLTWVIEVKTGLNIAVIAQAVHWTRYAHYVSVAIPSGHYHSFFDDILKWKGIGLILNLWESIRPRLNRKAYSDKLRRSLCNEHKTFAPAGNADGRRFTPYQNTCLQVAREVVAMPGITVKELIGRIDHHYGSISTARSCILRWAEAGYIKGVRVERDGSFIRFYPVQEIML